MLIENGSGCSVTRQLARLSLQPIHQLQRHKDPARRMHPQEWLVGGEWIELSTIRLKVCSFLTDFLVESAEGSLEWRYCSTASSLMTARWHKWKLFLDSCRRPSVLVEKQRKYVWLEAHSGLGSNNFFTAIIYLASYLVSHGTHFRVLEMALLSRRGFTAHMPEHDQVFFNDEVRLPPFIGAQSF